MAGFWERRFPRRAAEVHERRTYATTNRGSITRDVPAGAYVLNFYPRSDSAKLATLLLDDLQSGHSADDHWEKRGTLGTFAFLCLAPCLGALIPPVFHGTAQPLLYCAVAYGVILTAMLLSTVFMSYLLTVNFTDMNKLWETAIRGFLDNDLQNKFVGIRNCMLEFRRFIKWRRYMTYVVWWALPVFAALEVIFLLLLLTWGHVLAGPWEWTGFLVFLALAVVLQLAALARYSYLRWYYTDHRDPTLQLCVMLAEENRDYVGLLQRGPKN